MAKLKRASRITAGKEMPVGAVPAATPVEPKVEGKPEALVPPLPARPEAKPEAPKVEAKAEPAKLEPPKTESKPSPAPAAEKTGPFKPVPNFDDSAK
jgi:hypothetical protein